MNRLVRNGALGAMLLTFFATAASAQVVRLGATLNGGQEAPAKVNTGAVGTADVSVDVAAKELVVNLRIFNMPAGTTGGHIHVGAMDTAGPIIFDFRPTGGVTGDFSINVRMSAPDLIRRPAQGINTIDDALEALINGNTYVNIHSANNPAGEIRGQLVRVP